MNITTSNAFGAKFNWPNTPLQDSAGNRYYWTYHPPTRNSSASSTVSIDLDIPFDFTFDKEGTGEKLAKWMGFASEFQTGDQAFDDLVYIDCEFAPFCETLAGSTQLRNTIAQILQGQVKSITAEKGQLTAQLIDPTPEPPTSIIDVLVPALGTIKTLMPLSTYADYQRAAFNKVTCANSIVFALFAVGFISCFLNVLRPGILVDVQKLIILTAGSSVIAVMAGLVLISAVFHGSPRGYDVLKMFLGFGIVACILCSANGLYFVNTLFDHSEPTAKIARVVSKYITHGKNNSTNYNLRLENWRDSAKTYKLATNYNFYYRVQPDRDSLQLLTHPGYLNMEWIEKYDLAPAGFPQ